MSYGHEQGAGAGGGIVAGDVFHRLRHEAGSHDARHGVGCVVFRILAAAVLVVVLDEILEEGGEEIEFFLEDALEGKRHDLVDDGAGEFIALGGDKLGDGIEEHDLFTVLGFHGKEIGIQGGDGNECGIECFGKVGFVLARIQGSEEMLGAELCGALAELHEQHLVLGGGHLGECLFPGIRLAECGADALDVVGEFVVEEFVEEDLGDDFVFIAVIAETVVGADAFEVVDEGFGLALEVEGGHAVRVESDQCAVINGKEGGAGE